MPPRDELLRRLGFTDVQRRPDETVTATTPETVPGFVLTPPIGDGHASYQLCEALRDF